MALATRRRISASTAAAGRLRSRRERADDAERHAKLAAVLDLHEGAHPVEPRVGLDAADRPDVVGDEPGVASLRPRTTATLSGSPLNASPSRFAPQPVT